MNSKSHFFIGIALSFVFDCQPLKRGQRVRARGRVGVKVRARGRVGVTVRTRVSARSV